MVRPLRAFLCQLGLQGTLERPETLADVLATHATRMAPGTSRGRPHDPHDFDLGGDGRSAASRSHFWKRITRTAAPSTVMPAIKILVGPPRLLQRVE